MKPPIVTPKGDTRITLKTESDIHDYVRGKYFNIIPWQFVKCYIANITILGLNSKTYNAREYQIKPSLLFQFTNKGLLKEKKEIIEKAHDYKFIPVFISTFKELNFGILIKAGTEIKTINKFFKDIGLIQEKVLSDREKLKKIEI